MALLCLGFGFRLLADCASFGLPFTDLDSESTFCAAIAEAYYTGITGGTSSTTFSPNDPVTRAQAAAFAVRTLDASLTRGSRRAALGQWWTTTPHWDLGLGLTTVGSNPGLLASDGNDIWVANRHDGTVSRVAASDGRNLGTWTGATGAAAVLVAMGRIFITGSTDPGSLYMIDPTQPPGSVATVASNLGKIPTGIAFDGSNIWTANQGVQPLGVADGTVSIITPQATIPWSVTTLSAGFSQPLGIVFDGTNMWVTDDGFGELLRLDNNGAVIQSIGTSNSDNNPAPYFPAFDGRNIWVPNFASASLGVVRATDGLLLKVFSLGDGNGLDQPVQAAFDGRRILVTNADASGTLSLFSATDLGIIGNISSGTGSGPYGVCCDGVNFWVSLGVRSAIGRF